jgi:hypothetical protein
MLPSLLRLLLTYLGWREKDLRGSFWWCVDLGEEGLMLDWVGGLKVGCNAMD